MNKPLIMDTELSETCRVSCQNKLVKLVHLFGFIIKKFVRILRNIKQIIHKIKFMHRHEEYYDYKPDLRTVIFLL
jgi:hypothetical protein